MQPTDDPGVSPLSSAYRMNKNAMELMLDGLYSAAIDTFQVVIRAYPNTDPGRFALNHLVMAYKAVDDYSDAINYLTNLISDPPASSLLPYAYYHKVLLLARTGEYQTALPIASNWQLISVWPSSLLEPTLIELGVIYKYGLNNIASGDSVFQQFLIQHPESHLAFLAALELGVPYE
ncbi:MAG: tetratricopeptide repeat protein [bacterium]|nr:tetratricopeptide repeat protein [bacterium]